MDSFIFAEIVISLGYVDDFFALLLDKFVELVVVAAHEEIRKGEGVKEELFEGLRDYSNLHSRE